MCAIQCNHSRKNSLAVYLLFSCFIKDLLFYKLQHVINVSDLVSSAVCIHSCYHRPIKVMHISTASKVSCIPLGVLVCFTCLLLLPVFSCGKNISHEIYHLNKVLSAKYLIVNYKRCF